MSHKVETLATPRLSLGEGPHWSVNTESLYLVDILESQLHRYHPTSGMLYSLKLDLPSLGFMVPVLGSKDLFLVGSEATLYTVRWDGISSYVEALTPLHTLPDEPTTNRINDGKCDPFGRVWFGTVNPSELESQTASLYSFSREDGLKRHLQGVGISNGLAWDLGKNSMYYIDSSQYRLDTLQYNSGGRIGNRRCIFDFKKNNLPFYPDGMTVDTDGFLWVACFGGSRVVKIDPESGRLVYEIYLPTANITSVAWGGKGLNELYVTSAGRFAVSGEDEVGSQAGCIFRVLGLNARGFPMTEFKME